MSKRNKRSKKGRKGGGFDSSSRKRGRDEVTGLFVEVNGEKLYSDRTYDLLNSQAGKVFGFADTVEEIAEGGGSFIELELSADAIAMTIHSRGIKWKGRPAEDEAATYKSTTRWALLGDFEFGRDGALNSGAVRESANWSYFTWNDRIGEYSSVDKGAPIQEEGIELFQAWTEHERVFDYLADYGDNLIEGDPKQNFYNFESSKYFENGWWDTPFATNLI
jgi:hypothetical protein